MDGFAGKERTMLIYISLVVRDGWVILIPVLYNIIAK